MGPGWPLLLTAELWAWLVVIAELRVSAEHMYNSGFSLLSLWPLILLMGGDGGTVTPLQGCRLGRVLHRHPGCAGAIMFPLSPLAESRKLSGC